jgi:DNA-binding response OmpR family regulator
MTAKTVRIVTADDDPQLLRLIARLLAYLAQNVGRLLTQDLLLEHVWDSDYIGESHMLQVNINRLRRKSSTTALIQLYSIILKC